MTDEAVKQAYKNHDKLQSLLECIKDLKPYVDVDLRQVEGLENIDDWVRTDFEKAKTTDGKTSDKLKNALRQLSNFRITGYIQFDYLQSRLKNLENEQLRLDGALVPEEEFKCTTILEALNYANEVVDYAIYNFKEGIEEIRKGMKPLVDLALFGESSDKSGFMKLVNPEPIKTEA
jgi:hypothetical protein